MSENVKEIDLLALFIRFYQFCKTKFKILFIAGIIGGGAGIAIYFFLPDNYKYEISGVTTEISADIIQKTINSSEKFFSNPTDSLLKELEVPNTLLKKVKSISASVEGEETDQLNISLITNSPISKKDAELLIFSILKRNSYIQDMLNIKKDQIEKIIGFLDDQIENYDQLPTKVLSEEGILIQGEETPTALFLKKKQYEFKLNYLQPVVINNFPVLPEPTKSPVLLFCIIGSMLLLIVVFIYFIGTKLNHMVINMNKQNLSVINYNKSA